MLSRLRFELAYLFNPPWDTGISPPELMDFLSAQSPGYAIDLGCGSGTNLVTMARKGWQVTGVDISAQAVRLAKRKARRAGITAALFTADLSEPFSTTGTFDLALDIGCFHCAANRRQYLDNLAAMLRPGGHWLMYGFVRTGASKFGLQEEDLAMTAFRDLALAWRTDGSDHGRRPSAWFLYEKAHKSP